MMKKIIYLLTSLLILLIPTNIFAYNNRIIDDADVLSENDEIKLNEKLDELSNKYNYDIIVYFSIDTSFGEDIVSEGCEFYDSNYYGYGDEHSGILLIANYEVGMFDVITTGKQVREKYDGYIADCYDEVEKDLGNDPYEAVLSFIKWVDTRFINENIDYKNEYVVNKDDTVLNLSVASLLSLIISIVVCLILKSQLKTEGKKRGANNYINKNSFKLTRSGDIFLYRSTTRRRIKTNQNNRSNHISSGGNGFHVSHTSSHNISHGSGGGRRF